MLKSGASAALFPDNKNASFTNKLPRRVDTTRGRWEMALLSARFPQNWDNINVGQLRLHYGRGADDDDASTERPAGAPCTSELSVPTGRYRRIDGVVRAVNRVIEASQYAGMVSFEHDSDNSRVSVTFFTRRDETTGKVISAGLSMSRDLSRVLGFDDDVTYSPILSADGKSIVIRARRPPDPDAGYSALLIYCDLLAGRIVGDAEVSVLRSVDVPGGKSLNVYQEYRTPHCLPVRSVDTETVSVHIRNEKGELVPFAGGTVDLSLFLRPVGSSQTP